jgi:hypothetical protein
MVFRQRPGLAKVSRHHRGEQSTIPFPSLLANDRARLQTSTLRGNEGRNRSRAPFEETTMKTVITVKNETAFAQQVLGYIATFGTYGGVVGLILFDDEDHQLSQPTGSQQADLEAVTRAFSAWSPALLAAGQTFQLQVNVESTALLDAGAGAKAQSGWVSLDEGLAFVFPAK